MSSPTPGPGDDVPDHGRSRDQRSGPPRDQQDYAYGRLYGRAPRGGGPDGPSTTLSTVYTFILVWLTTAAIMWFGTRMLGFERGHIGAAVTSLVVSLVAAIAITAWARNRRR